MNSSGFSVAIVDDDAITPNVLVRILQQRFSTVPFNFVVYRTVEEAKRRLDDPADPVDLWMVDGGLVGGVNVNGLCADLKSHRANFIRMSGDPGHVQEGLEGTTVGGEEKAVFLLKPFELPKLEARVQAFILAKPVGI